MSTLSSAPSTVPVQPMPLQMVRGTEAVEALRHEDNSKGTTDGAPTDEHDPWDPPHPPPHPSLDALTCPGQHMREYMLQLARFLAHERATNIIAPDRTPKKIFLDTTRLLAAHTDNVVDELWNYIKEGKLVPAAILLLAAQRQYRNLNGFDIIKARIEDSMCGLGSGKSAKAKKQLKEMKVHLINALVLVRIILKAGEALEAYIQTHSEASHEEVLGKVSAVLQNYNVGPTGKEICIEDLDCCPYDCGEPAGNTGLTKAETGSPTLEVKEKSAVTKKPRDSHLYTLYARDQFFPVWRSVLTARFISKIFPPYAPKKELPIYTRDVNNDPIGSEKLRAERHSEFRLGMLERNYPRVASKPRPTSNYRSRRLFGTAASTVLKMLKRV